jgi:hypothetical protein
VYVRWKSVALQGIGRKFKKQHQCGTVQRALRFADCDVVFGVFRVYAGLIGFSPASRLAIGFFRPWLCDARFADADVFANGKTKAYTFNKSFQLMVQT